jgi:hypothetical protein
LIHCSQYIYTERQTSDFSFNLIFELGFRPFHATFKSGHIDSPSYKNLYDRVSATVHSDVTLEEARSLFLETYLLLGEIITL